jgi:hypothetical protein
VAIGVRAWAEIRGSMVNSKDRIQLLQACPVVPNADLEPAWAVLARLAGAGWTSEIDGWKAAVARSPRLTGITYRAIGPMGLALPQAAVAAGVA